MRTIKNVYSKISTNLSYLITCKYFAPYLVFKEHHYSYTTDCRPGFNKISILETEFFTACLFVFLKKIGYLATPRAASGHYWGCSLTQHV